MNVKALQSVNFNNTREAYTALYRARRIANTLYNGDKSHILHLWAFQARHDAQTQASVYVKRCVQDSYYMTRFCVDHLAYRQSRNVRKDRRETWTPERIADAVAWNTELIVYDHRDFIADWRTMRKYVQNGLFH